MTASKDKTPPDRLVVFEDDGDGVRATYTWKRYRFMLNDGSMLDVMAIQDNSDLRSAVLAYTGADRIEGVALIPVPSEDGDAATPVPGGGRGSRRVTKKPAARPRDGSG